MNKTTKISLNLLKGLSWDIARDGLTNRRAKRFQKSFYEKGFYELKTQSFNPFWPFDPSTGQTRIFDNMTHMTPRSTYYCLILWVKSKKSNEAFLRYFPKTWFLGRFWPFDPSTGQTRIFGNMTHMTPRSTYYCLLSWVKSKKSKEAFWTYFQKTWFSGRFWPFDPSPLPYPQKRIFGNMTTYDWWEAP